MSNQLQLHRSRPLPSIFDAPVERIFSELLAPARRPLGAGAFTAPVALTRREDGSTDLRLDLPGVSREDVHVAVEHGQLVVSGERKGERSEEGWTETVYGRFERRFALAGGIDEEQIEAHLADGVLAVHLPVPAAEAEARREIEIG